MEEAREPSEGHPLRGPHRGMRPELPEGFRPLRLLLEPDGMPIEVQQPDVIVGRHSLADVRLALPAISRRHCRLVFENQQWRVVDLNSLNGVFVNGERMHEAILHHGDHLQLGQFSFLVEHADPILKCIADVMQQQKRAS